MRTPPPRRTQPLLLLMALCTGLCAGICAGLLTPRVAHAEARRFALLVAHPYGGPDTQRLSYPTQDAEKLARVLIELGGFKAADVTVLDGPTADVLVGALSTLEAHARAAVDAGDEAMLIFYYSGHAASGSLRLGDTRLEMRFIRDALKASKAQTRVAFLDACQSGAITRLKGGRPAPSFVVDVEPSRATRGHVIITSSKENEASQESDELRGSFFTHYLVSGLRGAADRTGDGQVTLQEAYSYAYDRTVSHTADTRGGTQHPTYTYDLQGNGSMVLTRLGGLASLVFPKEAEGTFLVYDAGRDLVVGEVEKVRGSARSLSVPAGRYVVKKRARDHLDLARFTLQSSGEIEVSADAFEQVAFEDDVTKGPSWLSARRTLRTRHMLSATVGYQAFFDAPTRDGLFVPSALVGLRYDAANALAPGLSVHVDAAFGQSSQTLVGGPYDELLPVDFFIGLGGVSLTFDRWWGDALFELGPRLNAVYLRRDFKANARPFQDLFTFSPGLEASVTYAFGRLNLGVSGRASYLRYATETEDRSLGFGEGYLTVGYAP